MPRRRFRRGLPALPAGGAVWFAARNRVVVTNEAGRGVRALTVEVCDRTIRFGDLPPGGSASARFGTSADESSSAVRGRLDDGTPIHDTCGYVVWEDYGRVFRLASCPGGVIADG